MSPLEIAEAFDAPLLSEMGSNLSPGEMPRQVTEIQIRYGEDTVDVQEWSEHGKPLMKESYQHRQRQQWRQRLVIGNPDHIQRPTAGFKYGK